MRIELQRFGALLRKEVREHANLFVITPTVVTLLLVLVMILTIIALPESAERVALEQSAGFLADLPLRSAVIVPLALAMPFVPMLFLTWIIYLTVCLYQDRKDRSFLFWQSMPVSDLQTVLSRVVTAIFIIPAIAAAEVLFWLLVTMIYLTPTMSDLGVSFALFKALLLALDGTLLFYCFVWLNGLLFLPVIGWFLLFSAYSRRVPFLWAVGSAVVLALLEASLLNSVYFGYWMSWTARAGVFGWPDVPATLFSYQMLVALLLGGVLLAGATLMRRFND